jgi:hypothetical protein
VLPSLSPSEEVELNLITTQHTQVLILIYAAVLLLYLEASPQVVEKVQLIQPQLVVLAEMEMLVESLQLSNIHGDTAVQVQVHQVMEKVQAQVLFLIFQALRWSTAAAEMEMLEVRQLIRATVQEVKM